MTCVWKVILKQIERVPGLEIRRSWFWAAEGEWRTEMIATGQGTKRGLLYAGPTVCRCVHTHACGQGTMCEMHKYADVFMCLSTNSPFSFGEVMWPSQAFRSCGKGFHSDSQRTHAPGTNVLPCPRPLRTADQLWMLMVTPTIAKAFLVYF